MTRTTGDLPKKFGAPKKGLIDGGDASTSNNKNGQAQAKKKVDKERMWLLRLRILIIVRAELRGRFKPRRGLSSYEANRQTSSWEQGTLEYDV
ncbi:hypothetical protein F2Q69_00008818 [Brassica cretica]|uniref:Uncharacterized protein n=1 Tax=Brassica cretica TaxID=69181 RepID=A0A8S9PFM5_BRACR|nr:hypothetical protein F2Q69_00008818 [Brassica cretica]